MDEDVGGEVDDLDYEEEMGSEMRMVMGQLIDEFVSLFISIFDLIVVVYYYVICFGCKVE